MARGSRSPACDGTGAILSRRSCMVRRRSNSELRRRGDIKRICAQWNCESDHCFISARLQKNSPAAFLWRNKIASQGCGVGGAGIFLIGGAYFDWMAAYSGDARQNGCAAAPAEARYLPRNCPVRRAIPRRIDRRSRRNLAI